MTANTKYELLCRIDDPRQLRELNEQFESLNESSQYVPFKLPVEVPISPGGNLVKVKLTNANGESVVRTMFYVR